MGNITDLAQGINHAVADLGGAHAGCAPPTDQNFLNFTGFFGTYY